MDRDFAILYVSVMLKLDTRAAEAKLDQLIETYAPELDALRPEIDTSLTLEDEEYFKRIVNNE